MSSILNIIQMVYDKIMNIEGYLLDRKQFIQIWKMSTEEQRWYTMSFEEFKTECINNIIEGGEEDFDLKKVELDFENWVQNKPPEHYDWSDDAIEDIWCDFKHCFDDINGMSLFTWPCCSKLNGVKWILGRIVNEDPLIEKIFDSVYTVTDFNVKTNNPLPKCPLEGIESNNYMMLNDCTFCT